MGWMARRAFGWHSPYPHTLSNHGVRKRKHKKQVFIYPRATHGPCHMFLWLSFFPLRNNHCYVTSCVSVTPLSLSTKTTTTTCHVTDNHHTWCHYTWCHVTDDAQLGHHHHNTQHMSRGISEKQGGPNDMLFGPRYVFFCSFFFYANLYIYIHVIRPTDPPSLQEWVGGPYLRVDRPTDPPSQQERVGGLYLHSDPTLAPTWVGGHFLHYTTTDRITQSPHHSCPHHSTPWHAKSPQKWHGW